VFAAPGDPVSRTIAAVDPDGDGVRFTLLQGPDGMTIGRNDGRLEWVADRVGSQEARIGIEDAFGLRGSDIVIPIDVAETGRVHSAAPVAGSRSGGGGAFDWAALVLIGFLLASRVRGRR
jgi:hypothetical protein